MLMLHKAGNVRFSLWHWWMATAPAPRFHQSSGGVKTCFWIHHPCIISPWTMGQSGFYGLGNVLKMEFVYVYNLFCHLIRFLTVMQIQINVTRKLILWASFTVSFNCVCFDTFLQHRCSMYNILSQYPAYFSFSGQHPDPCDLRDVGVPAAEARAPARAPAQLPPLHPGLGPRRPRHPALHPLRVQVSTSNNYRISNHKTILQVLPTHICTLQLKW